MKKITGKNLFNNKNIKSLKAIKIDVIDKKIIEVEISSNYKDIYKVLDCDLFTCISPDGFLDGDVLYVDDEGLLKDPAIGAFSIKGYPQVLSGHGLILGTDKEGGSISCKIDINTIIKRVRFEDTHYLPNPGFKIISL